MRVEVVVESSLRVSTSSVRGLIEAVLDAEGASGSVVAAFVDEQDMAGLNKRFRGLDGATDVLSFRHADGDTRWPQSDGEAENELGEVVVCPQVVARYAREECDDPDLQLGSVVVHGVLHLLGYDHETDDGEMRAREQELVREFDDLARAVSDGLGG